MKIVLVSKCSLDNEQYVDFKMSVMNNMLNIKCLF